MFNSVADTAQPIAKLSVLCTGSFQVYRYTKTVDNENGLCYNI